ncbi:hypothetical protein WJX75_003954 [Coccomyxa subellipsoidea]|uniref:Uncharacterized protein n=1 Tax=Coccomyxa subellipsoidea TaxID=248742 RepID=A0ABR2YV85_9CHLO
MHHEGVLAVGRLLLHSKYPQDILRFSPNSGRSTEGRGYASSATTSVISTTSVESSSSLSALRRSSLRRVQERGPGSRNVAAPADRADITASIITLDLYHNALTAVTAMLDKPADVLVPSNRGSHHCLTAQVLSRKARRRAVMACLKCSHLEGLSLLKGLRKLHSLEIMDCPSAVKIRCDYCCKRTFQIWRT